MIKTLLTLLLLVSGLSGQTFGNYKVIQTSGAGVNYTLTGVNVTAGSAVWVFFGGVGSCDINTYTATAGGQAMTPVGGLFSRTYTCAGQFLLSNSATISNGNIVVTVTVGGNPLGNMTLGYAEARAVDTASPLGASGTGTESGASVTSSALSVTGNQIIFAAVIDYYQDTFTAGASYTIPTSGSVTGAGGAGAFEYRIVSAGSYSPSFSVTGSNYSTILAVSLKAGSAPATVRKRVTVSQ
jgi:hypothetical protein